MDSLTSARRVAVRGVSSDGLATIVLPISSAGATFHDSKSDDNVRDWSWLWFRKNAVAGGRDG